MLNTQITVCDSKYNLCRRRNTGGIISYLCKNVRRHLIIVFCAQNMSFELNIPLTAALLFKHRTVSCAAAAQLNRLWLTETISHRILCTLPPQTSTARLVSQREGEPYFSPPIERSCCGFSWSPEIFFDINFWGIYFTVSIWQLWMYKIELLKKNWED